MKSILDLGFKDFGNEFGIQRYRKYFPNGYGISAVCGRFAHSTNTTYEVGILCNDSKYGWTLTYSTPITDDVLSNQTLNDIEKICKKVESYLPNQFVD